MGRELWAKSSDPVPSPRCISLIMMSLVSADRGSRLILVFAEYKSLKSLMVNRPGIYRSPVSIFAMRKADKPAWDVAAKP
jgi:hypothetical protein